MARKQSWIVVYPFQDRKLTINSTKNRLKINNLELSNFVDKLWAPKAKKGCINSYIAFAQKVSFRDGQVSVDAGTMSYKEVEGVNRAIEKGKNFAPSQDYNNCLSVGFITATSDGKIILQRRDSDVHCPNILIHEPCGYMTSMAFSPKGECGEPRYINDQRLFDMQTQLEFRAKELAKTFEISSKDVDFRLEQDLLGAGWRTIEMYFSTTAKIKAKEKDLKLPKGDFKFIPFEQLKDLINNQGRLSKVDITNYRPEDPREIPLLDESLLGIIYGYKHLTGERLNIDGTIERLNRDGLNIKVHDTSIGKEYIFPDSF